MPSNPRTSPDWWTRRQCLALLAAPLAAQKAILPGSKAAVERGRKLIDDAIAALGGDAFLQMTDRVEAGRAYSFYNDRMTGLSRIRLYTRYTVTPDSLKELGQRERQSFGKDEDYAILFLENEGWDVTFRGARPLAQPLLERYRESLLHNIFYILRQRRNEKGLEIEYKGSEVVDNQPVETVEIADRENNVVTVYLHQSTKLPVRQKWTRRDPVTRRQSIEVTIFNKYRDAGGGIKWPFTILRERDGEKTFEMFAESVEVNKGLADNLFLLPASVKKLPPAR